MYQISLQDSVTRVTKQKKAPQGLLNLKFKNITKEAYLDKHKLS